jgi:hypothetical protein
MNETEESLNEKIKKTLDEQIENHKKIIEILQALMITTDKKGTLGKFQKYEKHYEQFKDDLLDLALWRDSLEHELNYKGQTINNFIDVLKTEKNNIENEHELNYKCETPGGNHE